MRTDASILVQLREPNVTIIVIVFANSNLPKRYNFVPFSYNAQGLAGKRRKGASVSVICEGTGMLGGGREMDAGERKR